MLFRFQNNLSHLQNWLKAIESFLKDITRDSKQFKAYFEKEFEMAINHLKHYSLSIYIKLMYSYLHHYSTFKSSLENPYGVLLKLLKIDDIQKGPVYQKALNVFEKYRTVSFLAGTDKKMKKFLRIGSPQKNNSLKKKLIKLTNAKVTLKDKISDIIELNKKRRSSFFKLVKTIVQRMTNNKDSKSSKNANIGCNIEYDMECKIKTLTKKITIGKGKNHERNENMKKLEILKEAKRKQIDQRKFRTKLNSILAGNNSNITVLLTKRTSH